MLTTEGTLLGGRVRYRQPASGFRSGVEPVLLAASVPARSGDTVLEVGTGAGGAMLCLSARIPNCSVTGVEIDPDLAALAAENTAGNRFFNARVIRSDIVNATFSGPFDHAMANPPYHPADTPASSDPARSLAKHGSEMLVTGWIGRMAGALRRRGTLTLIVGAGMAPACIAAMAAARCRCSVLFPLWPKAGARAKLVILHGVKDGRSAFAVHAGLVLHQPDGRYTEEAAAILRGGEALAL
ncbi:MAG TPA: methyltransferase [Rhodopila sp.]|uniref:tRNA1(Val) (adenine(37)-N6)-methyltransferase n=1 Tax=Rhodopila sp. TaxID=2480087 RepID=UPI002CDE89ED|nr:methyltransferase [Rhodopila sp.]HVY16815.1 methyltransferase [Rhodopila sp.]